MKHANLVGGSTIARRISCNGSMYLETQCAPKESRPSAAAYRGTLLHLIMEDLIEALNTGKYLERKTWKISTPPGGGAPYVITPEDITQCKEALAYVKELAGPSPRVMESEVSAFIDKNFGGTVDLVIVPSDNSNVMHIVDYKFGAMPVSATKNKALAFYTQCLIRAKPEWFGRNDVQGAVFHIVQPKNTNSWALDDDWFEFDFLPEVDNLVEYSKRMADTYSEADLATGNHCMFCKAKSICPLQDDSHFQLNLSGQRE